ncbi:hypothetical protein G6F65_017144 [Rhizopus arrhizus]|nr:hypothetical protein G6F65_017144 [Rhizopus arrhizus]
MLLKQLVQFRVVLQVDRGPDKPQPLRRQIGRRHVACLRRAAQVHAGARAALRLGPWQHRRIGQHVAFGIHNGRSDDPVGLLRHAHDLFAHRRRRLQHPGDPAGAGFELLLDRADVQVHHLGELDRVRAVCLHGRGDQLFLLHVVGREQRIGEGHGSAEHREADNELKQGDPGLVQTAS